MFVKKLAHVCGKKRILGLFELVEKENTKPSLLFQQKTKNFLISSDSLFLPGTARGVFVSLSPRGDGWAVRAVGKVSVPCLR